MKKQIRHYRRAWATLLIALIVSMVSVSQAQAQAREQTRGRASSERVERKNKKKQQGSTTQRSPRINKQKAARANRSETRANRSETRANRSETRANRSETRANRSETRANRSETRANRTATRDARSTRGVRRSGNAVDRRSSRTQSAVSREPVRRRSPHVQPQNRVRVARDKHRSRYYKRYHHTRPDVYRHYQRPTIYVRHRQPNVFVHIDVRWPWKRRYHAGWSPRYVYKQVVYVEADWGRQTPWYRDAELDVRTHYRQVVRYANDRYAEIDIYIEAIELYEDGYFVGEVDRIPAKLSRVRAKVFRNGRVSFDHDLFLLGDSYSGFEMIRTRHYDGYILDAYHRSHGYRVGALDLRRERVVLKRRSRLFNPHDFNGFVPVSLLPEHTDWLIDAGLGAVSAHYYGDNPDYFYGGGYGYDDYGYEAYGYSANQGRTGSAGVRPRAVPRVSTQGADASISTPSQALPRTQTSSAEPLRMDDDQAFKTQGGATIRLKRQTEISRVE